MGSTGRPGLGRTGWRCGAVEVRATVGRAELAAFERTLSPGRGDEDVDDDAGGKACIGGNKFGDAELWVVGVVLSKAGSVTASKEFECCSVASL
jgi:hypothetical protein